MKRGDGNESRTGTHRRIARVMRAVRWASWMVPSGLRREWIAEWEAEFAHTTREGAGGLSGVRLWARAMGAVADAGVMRARSLSVTEGLRALRVAVRSLVKRPLFALIAVATIALAIGANTAFFSIFRSVLIRPLPYDAPEELVRVVGVRTASPDNYGNVSYPNATDWRTMVAGFDDIAAWSSWRPALASESGATVLIGGTVSWQYFGLFGMPPAAGRFFVAEDEGEGRQPVVIISSELWDRQFGADPDVVGSVIELNNEAYTVVGVAPRGFEAPGLGGAGYERPEVWRTPWFEASEWYRSGRSWRALARLAEGVPIGVAQAELTTAMRSLEETYPEENRGRTARLIPLHDALVGSSKSALTLLFGAVVTVLLVACANVASLLMSRAVDRRREVAVRAALGASRGRILTHVMAESVTLAVVGGAIGIGLAVVGLDALVALAGSALPRAEQVAIDPVVLLFAVAATLATGLLFGLAPALRALRTSPGATLGGLSTRGSVGDAHGARTRRVLVRSELAMTVVLLVGAALLLRSLDQMHRVDLGVERDGVVTLELHGSVWWDLTPAEAADQYRRLTEEVTSLPGVLIAGATDYVPLDGNYSCDGTSRADLPEPLPGEGRCTEVRSITPGAISALGIDLLRGRDLLWSDGPSDPRVALVSQATAELFWPEEEALGGRLVVHSDTFAVAGIVSDVRHLGPQADLSPFVYLPSQQEPWNGIARGMTVVVRGETGLESSIPELRAAVTRVVPDGPISAVRSMDALLAEAVGAPRFRTLILMGFGLTALLLSLVGVGGVMAYSVTQRTREIGVRIALGAESGDVLRLVMADGVRIVLGGVLAGLAVAVLATRLVSSFLFGVSPLDPLVLAAVPIGLGGIALLACAVPALRAARTPPTVALTSD